MPIQAQPQLVYIVFIKAELVKVLIKTSKFGFPFVNGYLRHFKSEFAAVKSEVGLLYQLIQTS